MAAQRALIDGGRWHFQHGPMDIVIGAEGDAAAVAAAHEAAWAVFEPLLNELVAELHLLRQPIRADAVRADCPLQGATARRMWLACWPYRAQYITSMAAVAGSVAQQLLQAYEREGITRAWVNNGGDIALHLAEGAQATVGLYSDIARLNTRQLVNGLALDGQCTIDHTMPVRGIATSGWRGRSFSLGIADSVTVLAQTAAQADAAATIVANAVDLPGDARIVRRCADDVRDNSDLGDIAVTVNVPPLGEHDIGKALAAGLARAETLRAAGLIEGALLMCQGHVMSCGQVGQVLSSEPAQVGSVFA